MINNEMEMFELNDEELEMVVGGGLLILSLSHSKRFKELIVQSCKWLFE